MFLLALLAVISSGAAIALVDSWGPLYHLNLVLHPLVGLGVSVFTVRLWSRERELRRRRSPCTSGLWGRRS